MTDTRTHAREEKKLSVIRKGHWRNKFSCERSVSIIDTGHFLPGEHISPHRWPTAEIAEQRAIESMNGKPWAWEMHGLRYLGPVFFPSDDP